MELAHKGLLPLAAMPARRRVPWCWAWWQPSERPGKKQRPKIKAEAQAVMAVHHQKEKEADGRMKDVFEALVCHTNYAILAVFAQNVVFTWGLARTRLVQLVGGQPGQQQPFVLMLCITFRCW